MDKLANTRAFLMEAGRVNAAKRRWEVDGSEQTRLLSDELWQLDQAIRADSPGTIPGVPGNEASTDVATKTYATNLAKAAAPVRRYSHSGRYTVEQTVIFGEGTSWPGNPGYLGDLIAAIQKDDPTWSPTA